MIRGTKLKVVASYLLLTFIFQIIFPTISFALTGGPSSPEVAGFTPVGSDNLVDLSTGDFSYSLPLMTVPGPNGGYPITMGYKSGITMEQEASWVGLGWDLNVGSINRSLRGLPDDFNGDQVTQELSYKDNQTISAGFELNSITQKRLKKNKVFGSDFKIGSIINVNITHNNYLGLSASLGKFFSIGHFSINPSFGNKDGISVGMNYSLNGLNKKMNLPFSVSANFNSAQGIRDLNFNFTPSLTKISIPLSAGYSFAKMSPIGEIQMDKSIKNRTLGFGKGIYNGLAVDTIQANFLPIPYLIIYAPALYKERFNTTLSISNQFLNDNTNQVNGYGYNYLENAKASDLMDFHKEGGTIASSPVASLPVIDYDVYSVTGHGVLGSFRAYRGDFPMLKPQRGKNKKTNEGMMAEIGKGNTGISSNLHLGATVPFGGGESGTGAWGVNGEDGKMNEGLEDDIYLSAKKTEAPLYQSFYYDYLGSSTQSNNANYQAIKEDIPVRYNIEKSLENSDRKIAEIKTKVTELSYSARTKGIKTNINAPRQITTSNIAYKTRGDLYAEANQFPNMHKHIINSNGVLTQIDYNTVSQKTHHVNEISVTNTQGMKYVYGLPAYNLSKEDNFFSVDAQGWNSDSPVIDYDTDDATVNNKKGLEHYYKSTKLPGYTYSHLLTATYSSDYVDLKQDGPTDDDFGYWCKFNYEKNNNVVWRAPFTDANFAQGNYSDSKDDKASFSYGEREQYYVKTIETKTHVAKFYTSDRKDGHGALQRNQFGNDGTSDLGTKSKKLDSIQLFSKEDMVIPVKTAHFEYNNSLCVGVPNALAGEGKLTLKKVWFTYQGNRKGELTPYEFDYGYGLPQGNPIYSYMHNNDRWGSYQSFDDLSSPLNPKEFPYTFQENSDIDLNASSWNLTKIQLPSGGSMEVTYESDDYAYVQTKRAAQMYKIIGFSKQAGTITGYPLEFEDNSFPKNYLLFEKMDGSVFGNNEVEESVKDLKNIYFKAFVELKKNKEDYISGYMKPGDEFGLVSNTLAYVEVLEENYGDDANNKIHPIHKAACQHYHERVDLQPNFSNPFSQLNILFSGPIGHYKNKNKLCRKISLTKPSFVRLNNSFLNKKGGGNRVKSVLVKTGWGNETYGSKYSYKLKDGKSSGVADYEPIIGGEENAMKEPLVFDDVLDYNSYKGISQFFIETPYAEAFYPAPLVRYSRVITESITPQDIDNTSTDEISNLGGITVNEFYTSKDFPVFQRKSDKDVVEHFRDRIPLPFGADRSLKSSKGTSQGFVVELNDMAGKPKSVATYDYKNKEDLNDANIKTKVEYIYHTKNDDESRIDANVKVLTQDGVFEDGNIGRKEEFYVYQQEDYDFEKNKTGSANLGLTGSVVNYITPFYQANRAIAQRRLLVTNKVIYKTGILKEVRTFDNGRQTISKNLAYDAQTGEALVQVQENDFNAPIYSYNYPGHWKYDALGGKYQNYRARFKVGNSSPPYRIEGANDNVEDILHLGDKLRIETANSPNLGKEVYVTKLDVLGNLFEAKTIDNQPVLVNDDIVTVIRSGYKNMQSSKVGSLVLTKNPLSLISNGNYLAFKSLVDVLALNNGQGSHGDSINCHQINYGLDVSSIITPATSSEFAKESRTYNVTKNGEANSCDITIEAWHFDDWYYLPVPNTLKKNYGNEYTVEVKYYDANHQLRDVFGINTRAKITSDCDFSCDIEGILHASATELTEDLNYDYEDAGNPVVEIPGQTQALLSYGTISNPSGLNPYAFGQKNIWRAKRSWVYQVDRKQSTATGTEIDKDGEYETFKFFNWYVDSVANEKRGWTWTNQMTKYSPYGFDLENKNPLNIHSTEMYGTNHSTVIAKATNARNNEIAFENFETNNINGVHTLSGHFDNTSTVNVGLEAHTGNHSMRISLGEQYILNTASHLTLDANKKYLLSFWMYVRKSQGADVTISNTVSGASYIHNIYNSDLTVVDGWAKIDIPFTPQSTGAVSISFTGQASGSGFTAIDDIRIHPFNGSMNTYVYDSKTLKVTSELDHLNFSTLYNYDQEGGLVQVKKETEKGIFTVKTSRSNISH